MRGIAKKTYCGYVTKKARTTPMPTIMPKSELVRRAFAYLQEKRKHDTGKSLSSLLDEAGMRFNLTPVDAEALERLLCSERGLN